MSKVRTEFRCGECGAASPKWAGKCGSCGAWNTLTEDVVRVRPSAASHAERNLPVPIAEVSVRAAGTTPTGIPELDRVLGGGLVPGSVTLLGGEPGIGKSTLLLQAASKLAAGGAARCLLASAEESKRQVRLRAERLEAFSSGLWLLSETNLAAIVAAVDAIEPGFLILDSIQAVFDPELSSSPGSVSQVRECAYQLVQLAKERDVTTIIVGHVTKDGALAGPRVLEHVVDTVLSFEGERHHALRLLRAVKHRFGSTNELGVFEMAEGGLMSVADAGAMFLSDRKAGVSGSVALPAMEGRRPLLVEIQALVTPLPPNSGVPARRWAQGLDGGRLALLLAVLQRRAAVDLSRFDVYALVAGGLKVTEPGADLALALALASAATNRVVPDHTVVCGELGLAGEVRQVPHMARRLNEAARLGFTRAIVPTSAPMPPPGIETIRAGTLQEAVREVGLTK